MGVWGSPQTVSGCAQGAAGTVAGNRTEDERVSGTTGNVGQGTVKKRAQIPCSTIPIQYARELEVGERAMEQCRIDNPLEIACNVLWIVRLPLAQFGLVQL